MIWMAVGMVVGQTVVAALGLLSPGYVVLNSVALLVLLFLHLRQLRAIHGKLQSLGMMLRAADKHRARR